MLNTLQLTMKHVLTNLSTAARIKRTRLSSSSDKIPRQVTPPQNTQPNNVKTSISILSANVAGLRSILSNPDKLHAFKACITRANPDILCLQETKLQEKHEEEIEVALANEFSFSKAIWTSSRKPGKLGYSGVSCLLMNKNNEEKTAMKLLNSWEGFDNDSGTTSDNDCETTSELSTIVASEGRLLTLEFEHMFVVNAYVPNSGQGLKRLAYRTQEWDIQLGEHLRRLKKPVILIGDLNVAHNVIDIHNFYQRPGFPTELGDNEYKGLSQLKKQAGCTPIERESFSKMLGNEFTDSFRHFNADATGCFSYWSMRAKNRVRNRGLRLDYCVVSNSIIDDGTVVDSFLCDDLEVYPSFSDHCPVGIELLLPLVKKD